ncbi:MAG: hypothetical protein AAF483_01500 [Planctomycetota bacterium]
MNAKNKANDLVASNCGRDLFGSGMPQEKFERWLRAIERRVVAQSDTSRESEDPVLDDCVAALEKRLEPRMGQFAIPKEGIPRAQLEVMFWLDQYQESVAEEFNREYPDFQDRVIEEINRIKSQSENLDRKMGSSEFASALVRRLMERILNRVMTGSARSNQMLDPAAKAIGAVNSFAENFSRLMENVIDAQHVDRAQANLVNQCRADLARVEDAVIAILGEVEDVHPIPEDVARLTIAEAISTFASVSETTAMENESARIESVAGLLSNLRSYKSVGDTRREASGDCSSISGFEGDAV